LEEVALQQGEPARSHRFSILLSELFSDIELPVITDYLAGLEKFISAADAAKCRVSRGQPDALFGNLVVEFERRFPEKYKEAKRQLQKYVALLRKDPGTRDTYFTPIATDGISFRVFAPQEGQLVSATGMGDEVLLEEVENFDASKRAPIATFLCAAVVRSKALTHELGKQEIILQRFLADYVTYFFETEDREEAEYLTGVLNSPAVDALVKPMQARGLWGPRDITKKVWELPIPQFDAKNRRHVRMTEITRTGAKRVTEMLPQLMGEASIGRARTAVRQALKEELAEIDSIVNELLK